MRQTLQLVLIVFLLLPFVQAKSQDYKLKSADGEFIMEVEREPSSVKVTFYFTDPSRYSYLIIEREMDGQFRQCGYMDMKNSYGGAIEVYDNYPPSDLEDCNYRVRTVTTDKIERIYPPVRLPAAAQLDTGNKSSEDSTAVKK